MAALKFSRGGGQSCAIVGCTNNRKKIFQWKQSLCDTHGVIHNDCPCCLPYSLHKLPTAVGENRQKWVSCINRKALPKEVFVCSVHFVEGRPTELNPYPTLNLGYETVVRTGRRILKRKELNSVKENADKGVCCEDGDGLLEVSPVKSTCATDEGERPSDLHLPVEVPLYENVQSVRPSVSSTGTQWIDLSLEDHDYASFSVRQPSLPCTTPTKTYSEKGVNCRTNHVTMSASSLTTDSISSLYTGLNLLPFQYLTKIFETISVPFKFTMPVPDQLLLTLMKLRLNLLFADIAHRFGISESHASNVFNSWLPFLAVTLKDLIIWLPRETIRATMPSAFQEKYPHTTVIVDCAETFLQMPKNLKTRGETYSHYKSHNTVKYLVGIAPHGQIMFISKGFGGRASDKFIVENSGFLSFLLPGDEVMADRGFTISDLLFPLRVKLNIPAFTHGKKQLSEEDVTETRRIAHVRIHVERAIRRLKVFSILSDTLPISCAKKIDDILIVCSALVNLGNPLIKRNDEIE